MGNAFCGVIQLNILPIYMLKPRTCMSFTANVYP